MDNDDSKPREKTSAVSRRTVLGSGAAIAGGAVLGQFMKPMTAFAAIRPKVGAKSGANTFLVTVVGEMMATRPFSMLNEPDFLELTKLIRESDLAYGHLEMNIGSDKEIKWTPRGTAGVASYMITDPVMAHEIKWLGLDAVSLACNHSFDWGPQGILSTIKHCQEAGMAVAGTGGDLETARAPAFFEKERARIAMVSVSSGNNLYEWAGYGKGNIPGRPGVNPLRVGTRYEVPHEAAEQLRAIGKNLRVLGGAAATRKEFNVGPGGGMGAGTGTVSSSFVDSDRYAITSYGHPGDIKANLRSIDEAKKLADFVIVAHHNSTSEGSRGENPSGFVEDFARKAIDTGADLYVGHGWHYFLGIEIYKGKPIIYGVGNFFYQTDYLTRIPPDSYESYGYNMDELTTLNPGVGALHPAQGQGLEDWCWTAVYQLVFANEKLTEIRMHPVEMGMEFSSGKGKIYRTVGRDENEHIDGSPRLARGASGQEILKRLQHRCELRGTKMDIVDNLGVIKVPV